MARYDSWSQEDLAWKCRELEDEVERLQRRISDLASEKESLRYKVETELEPRLKSERARYDNWVTNPERSMRYYED